MGDGDRHSLAVRLVRPDVAKELTFTARIFDGREAAALGLATRLSDDPLADAMALAAEIAERSPDAVRGAKRLFDRLANDVGAVARVASFLRRRRGGHAAKLHFHRPAVR